MQSIANRLAPICLPFCILFTWAASIDRAHAGASACQWVVVVNGDSIESRTIANHYCSLRNIPMRNVIVLKDVPASEVVTIDLFRDKILSPLLKEAEARGLTPHIQGIAYSSGFPSAITLDADLESVKDRSPYLTAVGSINGMTYLYRYTLAKNPQYLSFESNWYASRPATALLNPLIGTAEQRKELEQLKAESNHEFAAELLDEIASQSMDQYPILYQSAQQWALAGNTRFALARLKRSIRNGWRYKSMIEKDSAFESLRDDKAFQKLIESCADDDPAYSSARGFDARMYYSPNTIGNYNPALGVSYMMSVVLAVNGPHGNSVAESIEQLRRSVQADGTNPHGTFVYTLTGDVRTTTREPNFERAIANLKKLGFEAKVVRESLPAKGEQCSGVMIGTPDFEWAKSGATLLPGAIADNLTSLGGAMTTPSQTKLTEFLRHGAAISSGAVTEPYAIQNKFPHPMIHVHYVQGLTAAEAFYGSVTCPYQLLIVGDPLCQPYSKLPRFEVAGLSDKHNVAPKFTIQLQSVVSEQSCEPELLSWIVDGRQKLTVNFADRGTVEFTKDDLGAHELRLLACSEKPIESRFEKSYWVTLGDSATQIVVQAPQTWSVSKSKTFRVYINRGKHLTPIKLMHDFEEIATVEDESRYVELTHEQVGMGPIRLQAVTIDASMREIRSLPITIDVVE